jgi:hypothetical protein
MRTLTKLTTVLFLAALSAAGFAALLYVPFGAGCSTTATIHMRRGKVVEAKIEGGDSSNIYLVGGRSIARKKIREIDHPGDVGAIVGGVLSVTSIAVSLVTLSDWQNCETESDGCLREALYFYFIGCPSIVIGIISTISAIGSYYTWVGSVDAAKPRRRTSPKITPVALTDGERTYWGIGMSWSW